MAVQLRISEGVASLATVVVVDQREHAAYIAAGLALKRPAA